MGGRGATRGSVPDWKTVHPEALALLRGYLRIDSSNPPGQEAPAARYLGALLEAEGITPRYIETAPGREILYARLPGDGSKRALMLANHTDVVPVEPAYWTVPAFEGLEVGGRIYGRGAVDMKGIAIMQLIAFLLVKRLNLPLRRDLVFCAVPDEEALGKQGMAWLCDHHPELLEDVEYELNEGGSGTSEFQGTERPVFFVATSEKQVCWLRLTAIGIPGHGSIPHPIEHNSAVRLARALQRLAEWERPITFTPETEAWVDRLSAEGLMPPRDQPEEIARLVGGSAPLQAMFTNTLNVTMIASGIKANVIPARSSAVVDCRLLPGQSREDWRQQVIARVDDPAVEVTFHEELDADEPVSAPWDTELYRVIEAVISEAVEGAVVAPSMTVGGTDNRFLRARGIPAYGFAPCILSQQERAGFHANDEFLTVENLNMGCELTYEIVRRMCA
ncbi:MAG: M20/M25/M40 family metallo-hydrolase [Chloroflexi bacterium]|nr:M20/M25/M40 family metallo-hydrolase [Chloroflexota bacterium]MDA1239831.1 M20/M25/M40 family metallo-hydrolase [Chloroflexota bacterium]